MRLMGMLASFMMLALIVGAIVTVYGIGMVKAPGPLTAERFFVVQKGQGVSAIAAALEDQNIITDARLFKIAARVTDKHTSLKAGEYMFTAAVPMFDVLEQLEQGDVFRRQFTVPEGLTSWQVVNLLNTVEDLEGEVSEVPQEGSLLPETYQYLRGDSRSEKILRMQEAMAQVLDDVWSNRPEDAPLLSKAEAVILASIVEKETSVDAERRKVAGVFHNRLKIGMPLQTDPTVIYAITKGKIQSDGKGPLGRRLLRKDLQYESPYNTYKYAGLPPGPIANPGRASLEAVFNPEKHDYLYFVADGTGGHAFAKTLAEHNANAAKWRQFRKSSGN